MPSSFVISSLPLRITSDRSKEKSLLPGGWLARSIKPRIGGLPWTAKGSDNLGGGKLGERFGEGHGQTIPEKKMSAMQKIILVFCLQCGQGKRMSNTNHRATAHTPADYDSAIVAIMKAGITGKPLDAALTAIRLARQEAERKLK